MTAEQLVKYEVLVEILLKAGIDTPEKLKTILAKNGSEIVVANGANELIRLFGGINPSYDQLFKRTPQRKAAERLLNKQPIQWWQRFMAWYAEAMDDQFCPRATTPMQLEDKLGAIMAFAKSKKPKTSSKIVV